MEQNKEDTKKIEAISVEALDTLRKNTTEVFSNIGTEKSRERMVFEMVEAIKTRSRDRFLWLLLKPLNSYAGDYHVKNLIKYLAEMHIPDESDENFEKISYTIVIGIMSAKGGE